MILETRVYDYGPLSTVVVKGRYQGRRKVCRADFIPTPEVKQYCRSLVAEVEEALEISRG